MSMAPAWSTATRERSGSGGRGWGAIRTASGWWQGRTVGYADVVIPYGKPKTWARIYEALQPLQCDPCGRLIVPGERFTRGKGSVVLCWFCQQFCDPDCELHSRVEPARLVEQLRVRESHDFIRDELARMREEKTTARRQRPR